MNGRNYNVDILKLLLSGLVVLIHSEVNIGIVTPFLRIAVPLFFIISSYFFFKKLRNTNDFKSVLLKFLKRNMVLYMFWFVLLLPITLMIRNYFDEGICKGIVKFLQSFFFNSTFRASWYLMALNIGMCISVFVFRKIKVSLHFLITLPIYLICCLSTNYYGIIEQSEGLMSAYNAYVSVFCSIANSFPASLLWIAIGRAFAENKFGHINGKIVHPCIVGSGILLIAEYIFVKRMQWQNGDDCYIMLIPLCFSLFYLTIRGKEWIPGKYSNRDNIFLTRSGNISTIIYVTHASVITIGVFFLRKIVKIQFDGIEWVICLLTMLLCIGFSMLIFALEQKRHFKWLKLLY